MTRQEASRLTGELRRWARKNIRLLAYIEPSVVEDSPESCVIRVPLSERTRNHVGSMYFGALCAGADAVAAWLVLKATRGDAHRFSILFKDVRGEFLRRAEGDVHFACTQGAEIRALIETTRGSGERESLPIVVIATVPELSGSEPVARFEMTLSARRREARK